MTPDQKKRLEELCLHYRYCFIIHGALHSRHNEKRMETFKSIKVVKEYEFIRITADLTYMFWNPVEPHHET